MWKQYDSAMSHRSQDWRKIWRYQRCNQKR